VKHRARYVTLYLPTNKALQLMLADTQEAQIAGWWDEDFELIASGESQH
jgi:hypothetical protein